MSKILGIGNALVDILSILPSDELIDTLNIKKGGMFLIDENQRKITYSYVKKLNPKMVAGGSVANTISGLAKLGVETGFIGKIGNDSVGKFFKDDCKKNGIQTTLIPSELSSGQCIALISPDGERTFCTYLGAACQLSANDLKPEMFVGYNYFHIEGYLVQNHDLIKQAAILAKEAGLKVSLDLASFNVVEENLNFLKDLVENQIDIVFANEEEAKAFTGKDAHDALLEISTMCEYAIVKVGKKGSYVKTANEEYFIEPIDATCVDTTGAGDLFASGFLYGLTQNYPLEICGKISSIISGNIVEIVGTKMDETRWDNIKKRINSLL